MEVPAQDAVAPVKPGPIKSWPIKVPGFRFSKGRRKHHEKHPLRRDWMGNCLTHAQGTAQGMQRASVTKLYPGVKKEKACSGEFGRERLGFGRSFPIAAWTPPKPAERRVRNSWEPRRASGPPPQFGRSDSRFPSFEPDPRGSSDPPTRVEPSDACCTDCSGSWGAAFR